MSQANKDLVRRWFEEVWNEGREDTIDELFAANAIGYGLGDVRPQSAGFSNPMFPLYATKRDVHFYDYPLMAITEQMRSKIP